MLLTQPVEFKGFACAVAALIETRNQKAIIMQRIKYILPAIVLLAMVVSEPAWADRGRHGGGRGRAHVGVYIGAPMFWPYYAQPYYYPQPQPYFYPQPYASPYSYYPPASPLAPPVYMQQQPSSPVQQYWYFCNESQGYYPYVQECPSGWQQVTPQPPGN